MEEFVGSLWHKWVSSKTQNECPEQRVLLDELLPQLTPYYRAMGGDPARQLKAADHRLLNVHRTLLQRVAGNHRRFLVSWQDSSSVRLPASLACFPRRELNEALYFWLAALSAQLGNGQYLLTDQSWMQDNCRASVALLSRRPGLLRQYQQLVEATLEMRQQSAALELIPVLARQREQAILNALCGPDLKDKIPEADGDPLPVPMWLYPAPVQLVSVDADEQLEQVAPGANGKSKERGQAKAAERIDDSKDTDGLLVFQLESLFSWTEQVALDRVQDESLDDDISAVAQDLDIITLSKQRRAGAAKVKFDLDLPAPANDELPLGEGTYLPEWDYRSSQFKPDFCFIQPMLADEAKPVSLPSHLQPTARRLKNRFSLLQPQRNWQYRQPVGDEIDLDAWLSRTTAPFRDPNQQNIFRAVTHAQRDLSCLILADSSMSTDGYITNNQRVIDQIKDTLLLFSEALSCSSDQFAIYAFSSVKNKQLRYHLIKNFKESYGDQVRGRILAMKPGFYTRMGAAIRQSSAILTTQQSQQRLLLILSDGKPNDIDHYEGRYGIEDTRKAIMEARQQGIQPFCVTIDDRGNDYLPYLFGERGYAVVSDAERLPTILPRLYLNLTGVNQAV